MARRLQWEVETRITAPVAKVWDAIEDLSLIPQYHPIVGSVEFVSVHTRRAPGVSYKCVVPRGRQKGWCVERVVDHIPREKTTVEFSEDSWGMGKMFGDFMAETAVEPQGKDVTVVRLRAYYVPRGFGMGIVHSLFVRRVMRKRARLTLEGLRRLVEAG